MKLIIDIDENVYNACNEYKDNVLLGILQRILYTAISNGIPLEKELKKIREEISKIDKIYYPDLSFNETGDCYIHKKSVADVIDNHISELKGE